MEIGQRSSVRHNLDPMANFPDRYARKFLSSVVKGPSIEEEICAFI